MKLFLNEKDRKFFGHKFVLLTLAIVEQIEKKNMLNAQTNVMSMMINTRWPFIFLSKTFIKKNCHFFSMFMFNQFDFNLFNHLLIVYMDR